MNANDTVARLDGVSHTYPRVRGRHAQPERPALRGVTFDIHAGQTVALLGRNGSGKSTIIRLLAGVMTPSAGAVRVLDADPARSIAARADLGVVFQQPALDPLLTIRENLTLHARLFGLSRHDASERIAHSIDRLGLTDRLDQRVGSLSGGLTRRADVARALLTEPTLLILDEATASLDPSARAELIALLRGASDDSADKPNDPLTIVMATHLLDEAEIADRVVMMDEGKIVLDVDTDAWRRMRSRTVLRTQAAGREPIMTADTDDERASLASVAAELTRAGEAFTLGPPSLDDLFTDSRERSEACAAAPRP